VAVLETDILDLAQDAVDDAAIVTWRDAGLLAGIVTDAMVERAAQALADWDGASGWGTVSWNGDISQRAYVRGARVALIAALGGEGR